MTSDAGPQGEHPAARRRGRFTVAAAVLLLIGGIAAICFGLLNQDEAPQPPAGGSGENSIAFSTVTPRPSTASMPLPSSDVAATAAGPVTDSRTPSPTARTEPAPPVAAAAAPVSPPVRVRIPAIRVDSELITLGLAPDGTVAVPARGPDYHKAAWFNGSPMPGAVGPAVIEGHVDSAPSGRSVFFELGALKPGNIVEVDRQDGSTVRFTVDDVRSYPKDDFPILQVYGNTTAPELRLITCGGDFDANQGHYRDNTVVFAHQMT